MSTGGAGRRYFSIGRPHPRSKPADGPVSRYLNRWLSEPISRAALRSALTPNQASFRTALLAIPMLLAGHEGHVFTAGALLQLASILDGVDGEIARAKGLSSTFGALLDTVLDYTLDSLGALALMLALFARGDVGAETAMLVGVGTVSARLISQYVVKNATVTQHHLLRDSRDVMTLVLFLGSAGSSVAGGWPLLLALGFVNAVRIDNTLFRMWGTYTQSCRPITPIAEVAVSVEADDPSVQALADEMVPGSTDRLLS